jgi:hypothetical protein
MPTVADVEDVIAAKAAWAYSPGEELYLMFLPHGYVKLSIKAMISGLKAYGTPEEIAKRVLARVLNGAVQLSEVDTLPDDAIPVMIGAMAV